MDKEYLGTKLCKAIDCTPRQIQWWHERKYLRAIFSRAGIGRIFTYDDAIRAGILTGLTMRGFALKKVAGKLQRLTPRYASFLVLPVRAPGFMKRAVVGMPKLAYSKAEVIKIGLKEKSFLVVDLDEIRDKLARV